VVIASVVDWMDETIGPDPTGSVPRETVSPADVTPG
jgi:hypothetical protein